jgi:hypothetical protein
MTGLFLSEEKVYVEKQACHGGGVMCQL